MAASEVTETEVRLEANSKAIDEALSSMHLVLHAASGEQSGGLSSAVGAALAVDNTESARMRDEVVVYRRYFVT